MPQKPPSAPLAFFLFFAGMLVGYWVFRTHGLAAGIDATRVWAGLRVPLRMLVLASFVACAYGAGGLLNAFLASRRRGA